MDIRYQHPQVAHVWGPQWTYQAWVEIELRVLGRQRRLDLVPLDETAPILAAAPPTIDIQVVRQVEERTRHDVAAFLEVLRGVYGRPARWLHFGLTSSDVVDTAQGMRFKRMYSVLLQEMAPLLQTLDAWTHDKTGILGRTHGQPAEPMEMRARAHHWAANVARTSEDLLRDTARCMICKLSGPVGTYAHNPPELEREVARDLGLAPQGWGASQVVPRSSLAGWANSAAQFAAACSKIATDIRLMNLLGEVEESFGRDQTGSSSMAHKRNPITAEQICGLARVAQGYAMMLQPLDLWLERDISHSSVERIAVPDLWHVLLHVIRQMTTLLRGLVIDENQTFGNLLGAGVAPLVSRITYEFIRGGDDVTTARSRAVQTRASAGPEAPADYMRHYPDLPGSQDAGYDAAP